MKKLALAAMISALPLMAQADTPSMEEMWQLIQSQQAEIKALKESAATQEAKLVVTEERLDITADTVEQVAANKSAGGAGASWFENTTIGGYGELHYNNLNDESNGGGDNTELDLHRFVLFFGHEFNSKTRFFSELEVEHSIAGDGKEGEVELEQAYIEHDYAANHSLKAGVFLVPVGILNETHEPETFYGVERNPVEKNIIPSTWWEGGLAFSGRFGEGFSYDATVTSGLNLNDGDGGLNHKVRDGRQKVSKAAADALAYTGRVKYTGIKGLELGLTGQYQEDLYQDELTNEVSATLLEAHVVWQVEAFTLKALYAQWDIDSDINAVKDGADEQTGWFVEPSYRINDQWGVFARYNYFDNLAGADVDGGMKQIDLGVNYWLTETVVFKADLQDQTPDASGAKELDGFNLGVGWSF
jgi:hypothetical protein